MIIRGHVRNAEGSYGVMCVCIATERGFKSRWTKIYMFAECFLCCGILCTRCCIVHGEDTFA